MKKTILIVVGVIVLVLVLGGAAYVGGSLLSGNGINLPSGSNQVLNFAGGDGGKKSISLELIPAKELPQTRPDAEGLFLRRADNSIIIGTGDVRMTMTKKPDGTVSGSADHSGPEAEVVVTHDTVVYRDVTEKSLDNQPSGNVKLQQVVEPGSIDEMDGNSTVQVWGTKSGERIVASVLVYSLPQFLKAKAVGQ